MRMSILNFEFYVHVLCNVVGSELKFSRVSPFILPYEKIRVSVTGAVQLRFLSSKSSSPKFHYRSNLVIVT